MNSRRLISTSASEPQENEMVRLKVGDSLPLNLVVQIMDPESQQCDSDQNNCTPDKNIKVPFSDFFAGKKIVILSVPGAYTPNSSVKHIPGYLDKYDDFKSKGVDEIVVISVNDPFVLAAWSKSIDPEGKIKFLADGDGEVAEALGLTIDTGSWGGKRMRRTSMLVDDGVIKALNVEESGAFTELSGACFLLAQLN